MESHIYMGIDVYHCKGEQSVSASCSFMFGKNNTSKVFCDYQHLNESQEIHTED